MCVTTLGLEDPFQKIPAVFERGDEKRQFPGEHKIYTFS